MIPPEFSDRLKVVIEGLGEVEGFVLIVGRSGGDVDILYQNASPEKAIEVLQQTSGQYYKKVADEQPIRQV